MWKSFFQKKTKRAILGFHTFRGFFVFFNKCMLHVHTCSFSKQKWETVFFLLWLQCQVFMEWQMAPVVLGD